MIQKREKGKTEKKKFLRRQVEIASRKQEKVGLEQKLETLFFFLLSREKLVNMVTDTGSCIDLVVGDSGVAD